MSKVRAAASAALRAHVGPQRDHSAADSSESSDTELRWHRQERQLRGACLQEPLHRASLLLENCLLEGDVVGCGGRQHPHRRHLHGAFLQHCVSQDAHSSESWQLCMCSSDSNQRVGGGGVYGCRCSDGGGIYLSMGPGVTAGTLSMPVAGRDCAVLDVGWIRCIVYTDEVYRRPRRGG